MNQDRESSLIRQVRVSCNIKNDSTYLSHRLIKPLVAKVSAIETRFFSPPDTPLTLVSPIKVFLAFFSPNTVNKTSVTVLM